MQENVLKKEKQLKQLEELLESGAINQEEFTTRKNEIIFDKEVGDKDKLNVLLFISFILTLLYLAYTLIVWVGTMMNSSSEAIALGAGLAIIFVFPHYLLTFMGFIFNGLGLFLNKRGFALTGAILYSVAILILPIYFIFILVPMILSYIGFAQIKKH